MRRDTNVANQWWGEIGGTEVGGRVVCCTFMVFEAERRLQCTAPATLNQPVPW